VPADMHLSLTAELVIPMLKRGNNAPLCTCSALFFPCFLVLTILVTTPVSIQGVFLKPNCCYSDLAPELADSTASIGNERMNPTIKRSGHFTTMPRFLFAAAGIMLLFVHSCTATDQALRQQGTDRIMAENSQMRKRIPLIERENDVLMQENLQYKSRLQEATERIDHLRADLAFLNQKFDAYAETSEMRILMLDESYRTLQDLSSQQISELNLRYEELESTRARELAELAARLNGQKAAFAAEKESLGHKAAQKEAVLNSRAAELKRLLETRDSELAALKTAHGELLARMESVSNHLAETQARRNHMEKELEAARAANEELMKRLQHATTGSMSNVPTRQRTN
jgi:hypothetical protein